MLWQNHSHGVCPGLLYRQPLAFAVDRRQAQDIQSLQERDLFGARQTAIRLLKEGWPGNTIVQDALNRPEWRNASMPDKKMLMDLLQETFNAPGNPSSAVIRDCMRRAEAAPKGG